MLLQRQTVVADSGCFFFFLLPSSFSAPLLCLFCSSLFNLWRWRCCRWRLRGTVALLLPLLFSSIFLPLSALSLSFSSLSVLLFFLKVFPLCFVLLASVFLFLHSARCPLSNHPLSFLFSVSFNSQNLPVVSFSLPPVFYSSLLLCLSLFFFCFPELPPWNLSFASLLLQNFPPFFTVVPPLVFISKRRRGSPYPCPGTG